MNSTIVLPPQMLDAIQQETARLDEIERARAAAREQERFRWLGLVAEQFAKDFGIDGVTPRYAEETLTDDSAFIEVGSLRFYSGRVTQYSSEAGQNLDYPSGYWYMSSPCPQCGTHRHYRAHYQEQAITGWQRAADAYINKRFGDCDVCEELAWEKKQAAEEKTPMNFITLADMAVKSLTRGENDKALVQVLLAIFEKMS